VNCAVALGSNVGNRRAHLDWAVGELAGVLTELRASDPIETEAEDVPSPQPPYLNMVVVGQTSLAPAELMAALLDIERRRGRTRPAVGAPRTLDLDLILYGGEIISTADLVVPHPRFRRRRFVLEPLAALAADWIDPVTGRTAAELLERWRLEHKKGV
jgi:2-amino-4-hydroxy-6-hydroxymethyldihydropteridine diphosphokinase